MQTYFPKTTEKSPAKINLFLQVTGKRPDGYHELHTLMCGITLYDQLSFSFSNSGISVQCDHPEVPEDHSNLVCKSAKLFFESVGYRGGVSIRIEKRIPVGAGLGGGSSNAATVLKTLNRCLGSGLSDSELMDLGLQIGADVPFFIHGKPAIATGIGEKLVSFRSLPRWHVLLINPGIHVSTASVYKNLNLGLTKCEKIIKKFPFSGVSVNICDFLCNDLETVTIQMIPDIERMKTSLMRCGAQGALMSGSGPTVFGLFSDSYQAESAYRELSQFTDRQKFLAELIV